MRGGRPASGLVRERGEDWWALLLRPKSQICSQRIMFRLPKKSLFIKKKKIVAVTLFSFCQYDYCCSGTESLYVPHACVQRTCIAFDGRFTRFLPTNNESKTRGVAILQDLLLGVFDYGLGQNSNVKPVQTERAHPGRTDQWAGFLPFTKDQSAEASTEKSDLSNTLIL